MALTPLQTPHSGYHWDGGDRPFFEGWYFRLTLPEGGPSFAFMYSIEHPNGGGAAQVMGPGDGYFCRTFPDPSQFWAWAHALGLGHSRRPPGHLDSPRYLTVTEFERQVLEGQIRDGYQVTATHHQGALHDPKGDRVRWHYTVEP
ncbi:MAG TPA: tocopherol cyclase family protein, partial [Chroococcidiopsis sp.]